MRIIALPIVSVLLLGSLPATAATASSTAVTTIDYRGIRPDDPQGRQPLPNPGRGFRMEISFNAKDLTGTWDPGQSTDVGQVLTELEQKYGERTNVTQLYFYLWDYAKTDLPQSALDNIQQVFDGLRARGYQAVLRFAYDDGVRPSQCYTVQDIQRHVGQLAPLIERNKDLIQVWQAGFVGAWGEWGPNCYNHQDYPEAVQAIMGSIGAALPEGMRTQMRYPWHRAQLTDQALRDRTGFANDYMTLGQGLWDFYVPSSQWWPDIMRAAPTVTTDGEMPWDKGQSADPYAWSEPIDGLGSAKRLQSMHYSTFSLVHNATVTVPVWRSTAITPEQLSEAKLPIADGYFTGADGNPVARTQYEYLRDHLGYRLEVRRARVGSRVGPGLPVSVDLVNRGFSAPAVPADVRMVLLDSSGRVVRSAGTGADWRTWQGMPAAETATVRVEPPVHTVSATLNLSGLPRGSYRVALSLGGARTANADTPWSGAANVLTTIRIR